MLAWETKSSMLYRELKFLGKGLAWETSSSMLYRDLKETFTSLSPSPELPAEGIVGWGYQSKNVNYCVQVLMHFPGEPFRKTPIFYGNTNCRRGGIICKLSLTYMPSALPYFVLTLSQKYSETTHISLQTCFNYAITSAMEGDSKYMRHFIIF